MTLDPADFALPLDDPQFRDLDVERELGGGGMSRVFLARDRRLDRRVVLKVLPASLAATLSVERFRREILLATSLQHPNIVPVLSAGEIDGPPALPFFVMPFIEGESLRERLLRGPLSVRETVGIARDVARALTYAHGRGIVHRDIKPGNVLLAGGAALVSDFGVAKALTVSRQAEGASGGASGPRARGGRQPVHVQTSLTALGTSLGTPAYMAPEQAAADPNVDHRADLYALGVVIYEMLAGAPPFHGRTPQALLKSQLSDPPPPIATRRYDVPEPLAALVMHALEKDPAERPRSAADVLRRLEDPGVISGTFAMAPKSRSRSRRRLVTRALALAVPIALGLWAVAEILRTPADAVTGQPAAAAAASPAAPTLSSRSIAILPLSAIGGDARARTLAEALASELAGAIASVPGVRVSARTAAARADSAAPGARAGDATLRLEGTVQREGEQLRVVLRLVNAAADSTSWSRSFDGRADSLLTFQSRIARTVADALSAGVGGPRR